MGMLIEGRWVDDEGSSGEWQREPSRARDWIRADGSTSFPPEANRYHLWLAWNCTWSQRCLITMNLLGLDQVISHSMAHWHRNEGGWWFREGVDELQPNVDQRWERWSRQRGFVDAEPVRGRSLHTIYTAGEPEFTGRATVPLLWDRETTSLVSNESSEILRMLELEFGALANGVDLLPEELREDVEATNAWVYESINDGVYRCGFADRQKTYGEALDALFEGLDRCDRRLGEHRYLCGDVLTEADVRLFPTLARFDVVYFSHFKCSRRRIADFPNLGPYLRDLHQTPGFSSTVNLQAYQLGYMGRSQRLNPSRIIPALPEGSLDAPHDRERLGPLRCARHSPSSSG